MTAEADRLVRALGLAAYVGLVAALLGFPWIRGQFWSAGGLVLILAFTIAGFYAWRRVCPLAAFGQLGQAIRRPGKRKVGERLERVYPLVQLGGLAAILGLRLAGIDSPALLLAALALAAAATSFAFTGKTWCNFFCPVGIVEKIATEPVQLRGEGRNAQCAPCTACKKSCPDIDFELGYWKERDLPARRAAAYVWPGLVAGFFAAPLFPWPPIGLVAGAAASSAAFSAVERFLDRHRAVALAGYTGLVLLACLAPVPSWLTVAAVAVATLVLARRWGRREETYVQEKFARGLLRRWEWADEPPPADLADVYLIHAERTRQRETQLGAYKETLHEMIADGVLSRGEAALLGTLRARLGVSERDHEQVLGELSTDARRLFDPAYQGSVERRLMAEQLRADLERLFTLAAMEGRPPDAAVLETLRRERGVSDEDWREALDALRAPGGAIARKLREASEAMATLRRARRRAAADPASAASRTVAYFVALVAWRLRQLADRAEAWGDVDRAEPASGAAEDAEALRAVARDASAYLRAAAAHVLSRFDDAADQAAVAAATVDEHPFVRETAVRALAARGRLAPDMAARALADPDPRVVHAATRVAASPQFATLDRDAALATLSTFEVMTFLHGVPLFSALDPDDLEALSRLTRERRFAAGERLCVEGEAGRDVFILVEGRARAGVRGAGGEERVIGDSGPGTCIGEMAALDEAPRAATVTAADDVRALVVPGADFKALLDARPAIARQIVRVLSQRLRGLINQSARTPS